MSKADPKGHQNIPWIESKTERTVMTSTKNRFSQWLQLPDTEVYWKRSPQSFGSTKYFAVFLDDATAIWSLYFLCKNSVVLTALRNYKQRWKGISSKIMSLRMDQVRENTVQEMSDFALEYCVPQEFAPAYAIQSNEALERLIQEFWKISLTLLLGISIEPWTRGYFVFPSGP